MASAQTNRTLCTALEARVNEEAGLTAAMLALAPADHAAWRPEWPDAGGAAPRTLSSLAWHLADSLSGFCAAFLAVHGASLAHFEELRRALDDARGAGMERARELFSDCRARATEGFVLTTDDHLARVIPTVFEPSGETVLAILLGNLSHLISHKHQLFVYLKLLGFPVTSRDLYRFREPG